MKLTPQESRAVDTAAVQELGFDSLLLMENAARGVTEFVQSTFEGERIFIVCGRGNNGGDGLAVARQLAAIGLQSSVLLLDGKKPLSRDATANSEFLRKSGLHVELFTTAEEIHHRLKSSSLNDLLIDCLLGTGVRGTLRPELGSIVEKLNQFPGRLVSVDVPSGLDCGTGESLGHCVKADTTITFVAEKTGFQSEAAKRFTGKVIVKPIGIPLKWLESWLARFREAN